MESEEQLYRLTKEVDKIKRRHYEGRNEKEMEEKFKKRPISDSYDITGHYLLFSILLFSDDRTLYGIYPV